MIHLKLTESERLTIVDVLSRVRMDLRMEIAGTDSYDYRQSLKARKETVKKVLETFDTAGGVRAAG